MKRALSRKNLWEQAPAPMRRAAGRVLGMLPQTRLLGRRFREMLSFLDHAQWWDSARSEAYQLAQLRAVVRSAYHQSRFYRGLFQEAGFEPGDLKTLGDLRGLPTIDKSHVRAHGEAMCVESLNGANVDQVSTGGSSGEPLTFSINADRSATEYAYLVSGWRRVGYDLCMQQAVLRGAQIERNGHGLYHSHDAVLRRHYYSTFHMTDAEMERYLRHIATIGPCFLHVYPSSMDVLTRFIQRTGMRPPGNIRGILAGSEMVRDDQRAEAEAVFGVRYYSWYGHSEKLVMASECERSTDYHVWPTYGVCELIDEEGRPVQTPGRRGEIVGTGFINTVMPFIRYRTGDFAEFVADRCEACGRGHMILRHIEGHRTQEMLVTRKHTLISWTALNMHDDTFDRVQRFQFSQDQPGNAVLWIVPADGFGDRDKTRIARNISRKLDGQIDVELKLCEQIKLTQQGKATYVDQQIDLASLERPIGAPA